MEWRGTCEDRQRLLRSKLVTGPLRPLTLHEHFADCAAKDHTFKGRIRVRAGALGHEVKRADSKNRGTEPHRVHRSGSNIRASGKPGGSKRANDPSVA
jgi:hypothetical protein